MSDRPFVFINMAMTADGKITSAQRELPAFTSRTDRHTMDRIRAKADAILIGATTLRVDDPPLHIRSQELRAARVQQGLPEDLLNVVVTRRAALSPNLRFFAHPHGAGRIVATVDDAPEANVEPLRHHAEIWRMGRRSVDLRALLHRLKARGVTHLLVEGGAEINWQLFADDLVDELYLTIAPAILGGAQAPTIVAGTGFAMAQRRQLELLNATPIAGEIFCHYRVRRNS